MHSHSPSAHRLRIVPLDAQNCWAGQVWRHNSVSCRVTDDNPRCLLRKVPIWYHKGMALNLRVPEDLDRRLEKLAAEEHTSKSALLLQGAELVLQRHARRREISEGLDFVMSHDAELLTRLEDA